MTDAELVLIIGPLARRLLGEPNMRLSNGRELEVRKSWLVERRSE